MAGHHNLAEPWWSRRLENEAFRHLMNLIGLVSTVKPAVVKDPAFLERSVLVDGVPPTTSPNDLRKCFEGFEVMTTVLVRDKDTGHCVGLVVFSEDTNIAAVVNMAPPHGFRYCVQATRRGHTRLHILDALDDSARRQPTAELLRSLIPPEYLRTDASMDFHLRCVFLGGPGCSGANGLCSIGKEVLLAIGRASAVIIQRARNIGVLVYDTVLATESVVTRASLLHPFSLIMYDSSLFPLPAATDGEAASLARRLLPPFVTVADYAGRVMLLETGLEKEDCDAALVAQFLERELDLRDHLEAVIVHRFPGSVFLVLGSQEDAQMLLQLPEEKWARAFGRPVLCHLLDTKVTQQLLPPAPLQLHLDLNHWISPTAMEILRLFFTNELNAINDHDHRGLTRRLIGLAALSQPHALRRESYFPDRAVLLTGIDLGTRESDLRTALARYGSLDEVVHVRHRGVALVVFTSWTGATRLLRKPAATRLPLGFGHCQPAPDAGFSGAYGNYVLNYLLFYQSKIPPFL